MDAIRAGKNVLCEKSFTINAKQAQEIFEAARQKNVYVAEAMWLRHRPLYRELHRLLHEEKIIGDVFRAFSDFASGVDIASLPASSRYRDLTLGAGSLLDVGVYTLTWLRVALGDQVEPPQIVAKQTHEDGIEITTSAILQYSSGQQGIGTSTTKALGAPGEVFAVVHGTNGYIEISGGAPSMPESFTVWKKQTGNPERAFFPREACEGQKYDFPKIGRGFVWEAEHTALDILAGRKESSIMPWDETLYMMDIMDEIRAQGGTSYPGE
jgi:predicted dehydrogenase